MKIPSTHWVVLKEKLKEAWLIHHENKINFKDYYLYINFDYENKEIKDYTVSFWRESMRPEEIEITKSQKEYIFELIESDLAEHEKLEKEREQDIIEYQKNPKYYYGTH